MGIQSIEDSKILREYCRYIERKGVADRIIQIAKEIIQNDKIGGHHSVTLRGAGKIRALAMGANVDCYWGEKQGHGFQDMLAEARYAIEQKKKEKHKK